VGVEGRQVQSFVSAAAPNHHFLHQVVEVKRLERVLLLPLVASVQQARDFLGYIQSLPQSQDEILRQDQVTIWIILVTHLVLFLGLVKGEVIELVELLLQHDVVLALP